MMESIGFHVLFQKHALKTLLMVHFLFVQAGRQACMHTCIPYIACLIGATDLGDPSPV